MMPHDFLLDKGFRIVLANQTMLDDSGLLAYTEEKLFNEIAPMNISEALKRLTVRMSDEVKAALEKYAAQTGLSEAAAAERFVALGLYNNGLLPQVPPVEKRRGGKREGAGRKPEVKQEGK